MFLASRFVAGRQAEDAIAAARRVNAQGIQAILDYLGEDVKSEAGAQAAANEYIELIQKINASGVRAAVSLKVSQMGILLSRDLCLQNLRRIARAAARHSILVWFDMEGSRLTRSTVEVFDELRDEFPGVGLCLQAALARTGSDYDTLAKKPFRVRLCKGAYKEPATVAYQERTAVEGNFRMLIRKMLEQTAHGTYPAFATHDPKLIERVILTASDLNIAKSHFEFQMLYGIQNKRLAGLAQDGYQSSVYIPYGTHWLPYFVRRLRERKENLYFLLRNVFRA